MNVEQLWRKENFQTGLLKIANFLAGFTQLLYLVVLQEAL